MSKSAKPIDIAAFHRRIVARFPKTLAALRKAEKAD